MVFSVHLNRLSELPSVQWIQQKKSMFRSLPSVKKVWSFVNPETAAASGFDYTTEDPSLSAELPDGGAMEPGAPQGEYYVEFVVEE